MRKQEIDYILTRMLDAFGNVSDLNITVGRPFQVETAGQLSAVAIDPPFPEITPFQSEIFALTMINQDRRLTETLLLEGSCDLSYELPGKARFRVNIFSQQSHYSIVLRKLETKIPNLEEMDLPEAFYKIAQEKNGMVMVTGATGSGKTTLLRLLNKLESVDSGKILVDGVDIGGIPPRQLRKDIGMVFQTPALFKGTIEQNILFGPQLNSSNTSHLNIQELLQIVGLDNIDVDYARKKGIAVYNTPGCNSQAVAELTIGLILSLSRDLFGATTGIKAGRWEKSQFTGNEISGKTLGLIGFGQIGQRVGKMATGLDMKVLVYKPSPVTRSPGFEFEIVALTTLLKKSDYVSLHLPLNQQSRNIIDREELQMMQSHAFLINCARGGIVNEKALLQSLDRGEIAAAGIDVYEKEPPVDFSLINHPKIVATPHIGASTVESQDRVGKDIAMAIMNHLEEHYLFL